MTNESRIPPAASPQATEIPARRHFLQWLIGSALGLVALGIATVSEQFMLPSLTTPRRAPAVIPPENAPALGQGIYVPAARAYLMRDEQGYFALSAICTHLGCLVEQSGAGLQCPCHGSQYDQVGRNLTGPASRPLDHWVITRNTQGALVIDPNIRVDATVRLSVTE